MSRLDHLIFKLVHPLHWRLTVRRLFVLVLPIGIALWLVLVVIATAACVGRAVLKPVSSFWNHPTIKRVQYDQYKYGTAGPRNQIRLVVAQGNARENAFDAQTMDDRRSMKHRTSDEAA